MSQADTPTLTPHSDERLFALLEQLLQQSRKGQTPDLQAVIQQFPHLEEDIRGLWATIQIAEDLAVLDFASHGLNELFPAAGSDEQAFPRDFGAFRLLEELGRGGMGIVYRAEQQHPRRIVALKMVLRGDVASAMDLARFRSEAQAAAKVRHPHIVPIYEVGDCDGQPYFSMQLIEGTTLAKKLAAGPLPSRCAAELLVPVCRAIADAHRQGVLHRDLKPSNILIDHDERTYVTDFGLAKHMTYSDSDLSHSGSLTQSGAILGTPSYMAPEQAAGKRGEVGPATDVYALGAVLYAMLTGRPPFQAPSPLDTLMMVMEQDPVPPRMLNPRADSDLEMIALKCLQKPIDLRYGTADALADDLTAYLANEPIAARSSHFSQILSRAFRETHHAAVLENWGLLWILHSIVVLVLCIITNLLQAWQVDARWPYVALWGVGVGAWAAVFWELRRRSGPITFVERQIAHVWAGSTIASTLLFLLEDLLRMPVLTLSPVLALIAGSVFLVKAGILSGKFYIQSGILFCTAFAMALLQQSPEWNFGLTLFGVSLALCFGLPGWKYWKLRRESGSSPI